MTNNQKFLFSRSFFWGLVAALIVHADLSAAADISPSRDANMGWRFIRGEQAGAEMPEFDDSTWRVVDLPHDWSIEAERGLMRQMDHMIQQPPKARVSATCAAASAGTDFTFAPSRPTLGRNSN